MRRCTNGVSRRPSRPICPIATPETASVGNRRLRRLEPIRGRLPPAGRTMEAWLWGAAPRPGRGKHPLHPQARLRRARRRRGRTYRTYRTYRTAASLVARLSRVLFSVFCSPFSVLGELAAATPPTRPEHFACIVGHVMLSSSPAMETRPGFRHPFVYEKARTTPCLTSRAPPSA